MMRAGSPAPHYPSTADISLNDLLQLPHKIVGITPLQPAASSEWVTRRGPSVVGRLDGKVAVITGGASGMGLAIAQVFVREDARVVIGDISGAEVAAADLGPKAVGVSANVSNAADVSQLVKTATD